METNQATSNKTEKIKLDFKDSKYATGRRKTSIAKVWLKRVLGKFMLTEKIMIIILLGEEKFLLSKLHRLGKANYVIKKI